MAYYYCYFKGKDLFLKISSHTRLLRNIHCVTKRITRLLIFICKKMSQTFLEVRLC